jgi:hypothetical protein
MLSMTIVMLGVKVVILSGAAVILSEAKDSMPDYNKILNYVKNDKVGFFGL